MIVVAGLVAAAGLLSGRRRVAVAAGVAAAFVVHPAAGVIAVAAVPVAVALRRPREPGRAGEGDEATLADLTVLGLSAGLTFPTAAAAAADTVSGEPSERLRRSLRFRDVPGGAPGDDPPLMSAARRALATGAPLIPAVSDLAERLRSEERARRLSAARRLPVKMLFPLALLILPGFLVLTVGPAVLGSLDRLGL
jgi:tight adherence protein C